MSFARGLQGIIYDRCEWWDGWKRCRNITGDTCMLCGKWICDQHKERHSAKCRPA